MHSLHNVQPPAQHARAAAAAVVIVLLCGGLETSGLATAALLHGLAMQDSLNRRPAPQSCHAYSCHQCWSSHLPSLMFAQQHLDPAAVRAFATSHHKLDAVRQSSPAMWSSMHTQSLPKPQECPVCYKTCCSVSCGLNFKPWWMVYLELLACLQILLHQLLASVDGSFLSSCHVIPALPHCCCTCC